MAFLTSAINRAGALRMPTDGSSGAAQPFIAPNSSGQMDSVLGTVNKLNRKTWDDYYKNYASRENAAYDQAFNTDFVGQAQQRADAALTAADAAGVGSAQDMLARYGQEQSGDQAAATSALTQLNNGARRLSTRNRAKWSAIDTRNTLQEQALNDYMQRYASGFQNANQSGQKAAQLKAAAVIESARKRARRMGALTAVAGLALAPFTGGASLALTAGGAGMMQ